MTMLAVSDFLAEDGVLAKNIKGFAPRAAQQEMAEEIAQMIEESGVLVCEAGTGTGKTFAYLVPALLSGKRVIISTGTKTLQSQLFKRDLPMVREALDIPVQTALLKGRSNYLCIHRMEQSTRQMTLFFDRESSDHLQLVQEWAKTTKTGDTEELTDVPEDSEVWPHVTSTTDNCLGQQCPKFDNCHVFKARAVAHESDILVINHHLFFADMAVQESGFGELLPEVGAVIFDEAHQLGDVAANFFGMSFTARQVRELGSDSVKAEREEAGDSPQVGEVCEAVETALTTIRDALGRQNQRAAWHTVQDNQAFLRAIDLLQDKLKALEGILQPLSVRGKTLENCYHRTIALQERLQSFTESPPDGHVRWFETYPRTFAFHLTPMSVANEFNGFREGQKRAWIFTSATLSVGGSFEHFSRPLGLTDARACRWESPFDYKKSAFLYVPQDMPEPNSLRYTEAVVDAAVPVLQASQGRAFMLFTSHRALQEAASLLDMKELDYPLFVQGSMPRAELLNRFRESGNGVLLGTGSFWEGVDVRGDALSCVIIDKLPFGSPGDPLTEAKIQYIRERGGNPFGEFQLPAAVISLKQGMGRLIRDVTDRGLLMICDPRIISKSYGRTFLDSLPDMHKTRHAGKVADFFAYLAQNKE